jgi:hypothetical protein
LIPERPVADAPAAPSGTPRRPLAHRIAAPTAEQTDVSTEPLPRTRAAEPPYRRSNPRPYVAATPPEPQQAQSPAPAADRTADRPPVRQPAPPKVVVVRAPAAPPGEAAFWERRHLGRLLTRIAR